MRAASLIVVALLLFPACSRCGRSRTSGGGEPDHTQPEPLAEKAMSFDGEPSDLVVGMIGEPYEETPVNVHVLRITDRGVEVDLALALPRRDRELPAAAVDGKHVYLARGTGVVRREPFTVEPAPAVDMGQAPASLLGLGPGCLVGLGGQVSYVDFSDGKGVERTVFESKELDKPVDFLVPLGKDAFVAVDDVVTPKYAFVLDLVPGEVAAHRFTAELPAGANERYMDVAARGGELVITATFGVMHGSGNTLYRWLVEKKELAGIPHEEFLPRMAGDDDERTKLLAGDKMTYWQGLGLVGDHAFIGAGARGVLHADIPVKEAALFDAGGYVLDLVVSGDRIIVLTAQIVEKKGEVELGQRHVVELAWDADGRKLSEKGRHVLPVPIDWLAI